MANPTLTREEMLGRIARVFRTQGYDAASLSKLAQATGLVKASLYHAFPGGKEDMARAVIGWAGERMQAEVLAELEGGGPPRVRLERFMAAIGRFYEGGTLPCALDVFSLGDAGPLFAAERAAVIARLQQGLAALLVEAGVTPGEAERRATDALVAILGALVVTRATGSNATFERTLAELPEHLLAGP
jgi:TetR/AcrR family transcriptional repressor of lmrAB and yxaGH operons